MMEQDTSQQAIPVVQSGPQPDSWSSMPSTFGEGIHAEAAETLSSSPTASLVEMQYLHSLEQGTGKMVDPDDFNRAHPELETPLTKPVPEAYANELADRALQRRQRAAVIARAPETLAYKGASFGTGLGLGLIDPISVAGFGVAGAALPAASGVLGGFARAFGEGALGSVPGQAIEASEKASEGINTSAKEFLGQSIESGVGVMAFHAFGMGVKAAWKGVPDVYSRARDSVVRRFGEPVTAQMERVAENQMAAGERVDLSPAVDAAHLQTSGDVDPPPGAAFPEYEHEPVTSLEGKKFYYGSPTSLGDFKDAPKRVIGHDLGDGIYLSDNPWRENGAAAGGLEGVPGKLHEVGISPETKLMNLEEPLSGDARSVVQPYLEEIHGEKSGEMIDTMSGKDVMNEIQAGIERGEIPETSHSEIQEALSKSGYDGYQFVDKGETGGGPHNVAMLFDPENTGDANGKVTSSREFEPDQASVPSLSPERQSQLLQDHGSPTRDALYDPKLAADLEKRMENTSPPPDHLHALKKHVDDLLEQAQALRDQGSLSDSESTLLDSIKDFDGEVEDQIDAIKNMAVCLRSG